MSTRLKIGLLLLTLTSVPLAARAASKEQLPPQLAAIKAVPAKAEHLVRSASVERNPEDEGSELPISIYYNPPSPHEFDSFLVVTDESLCRRPEERAICTAFRAMISGRRPAVGAEITDTRIGGVGYATLYLAPVEGVKFPGVDVLVAFLGGDTQDDPAVDPVLYLYARRGSNLLELSASVGPCEFPVPEAFLKHSEAQQRKEKVDYYRRSCATPGMLIRARAAGKKLAEVYRLAP